MFEVLLLYTNGEYNRLSAFKHYYHSPYPELEIELSDIDRRMEMLALQDLDQAGTLKYSVYNFIGLITTYYGYKRKFIRFVFLHMLRSRGGSSNRPTGGFRTMSDIRPPPPAFGGCSGGSCGM